MIDYWSEAFSNKKQNQQMMNDYFGTSGLKYLTRQISIMATKCALQSQPKTNIWKIAKRFKTAWNVMI